MNRWTLDAPLQPGVTLLEASAGTGKTYSIVSLALRLLLEEGLQMSELVVVTFTRAATAELRDRLRQRLLSVRASWPEPRDPIVARAIGRLGGATVAQRLSDAVEQFDRCLISTIHGFCQRMLSSFAFESGADFELELVDDNDALIEELVTDWLTRELHPHDPDGFALRKAAGFGREALTSLARAALADPEREVWPEGGELVDWQTLRDDFAVLWRERWAASVVRSIDVGMRRRVFKPRQRTYNRRNAAQWVAAITAWLEGSPGPADSPDRAAVLRLSEAGVAEYLAPGGTFEHPAFKALEGLLSWKNDAAALHRGRFVRWVRVEAERRLEARRQQRFSDLLLHLARRLRPSAAGSDELRQAIGRRYRAALIDEFQDTDALQWSIFRTLFGGGAHHLYLIGDPKQAIYGFRGANIQVYLEARAYAGRCYTMDVNWRSDAAVLDALNQVLGKPGIFGDARIPYVAVGAPPRVPVRRLMLPADAPDGAGAALRIRFLDGAVVGQEPAERPSAGQVLEVLPSLVASDVVRVLTSGARIHTGSEERGVLPGDLAVLVRSAQQAQQVVEALARAAVPAVVSGVDSVLHASAADALLAWMAAVEQPARVSLAREAITTLAFGWRGDELAALEREDPSAEARWEAWLLGLKQWHQVWLDQGFYAALRRAMEQWHVAEKVLGSVGGERWLTNWLHLAELLHEAELAHRLGIAGCRQWLLRERARTSLDRTSVEQRLERDDTAVQVMTVHKSKGLEFPIVFVPYLWRDRVDGADWVVPHPDKPAAQLLDLRDDREDTLALAERAAREESLRLLYVALTRARLQLVLYTSASKGIGSGPLSAVLHGDGAVDRVDQGRRKVEEVGRDALFAEVTALATAAAGIHVSVCAAPRERQWQAAGEGAVALRVRDFARPGLDASWKRHSYSALTRGTAVLYVDRGVQREGVDIDADAERTRLSRWAPQIEVSPNAPDVHLAGFPAGADAGTCLHEVFEKIDFAWGAPEAAPEPLKRAIGEILPTHGFDVAEWGDMLQRGMMEVLQTPLGGVLGSLRLCDIPMDQRFDELRFDFPIAPGPTERVTSEGLVAALRLREGDEVMRQPYLDGLGSFPEMRGFMTGAIDLIVRAPTSDGLRWFVVDYKSNRLDPQRTRRYPIEHFSHVSMRYEMEQHHYFLQYHLYLLALHRYLRWRVPDYDYDTHIGGAYYLFFRGMVGAGTPSEGDRRHGCFYDRPRLEVIEALDALFEEGG